MGMRYLSCNIDRSAARCTASTQQLYELAVAVDVYFSDRFIICIFTPSTSISCTFGQIALGRISISATGFINHLSTTSYRL